MNWQMKVYRQDRKNKKLKAENVELRTNLEAMEQLQTASIDFYCGVISKAEWRVAVQGSPKGQELIALAAAQEEQP